MMLLPLGCRGPGKLVGLDIHHLVGGEVPPASADLRGAWTRYPDQRGSSCFGNAWAQFIRTSTRGLVQPSAMAIWGLAREIGLSHPDPTKPLEDVGVYGHDVLESVQQCGVVRQDRWPDDVDIGAWIPQDVIAAGMCARLETAFGIDAQGDELELRIEQTLGLAGLPVVFGMNVDLRYMQLSAATWSGYVGPSLGGHAQCIVSYDEQSFTVANSWGPTWAGNGCVRVPRGVFRDATTYDFQTAVIVPVEAK